MSSLSANQRIVRARDGAASFEAAGLLVLVTGTDGHILYSSEGWSAVFTNAVGSLTGSLLDTVASDSRVQLMFCDSQPSEQSPDRAASRYDAIVLRYGVSAETTRTLEGTGYPILAGCDDRVIVFRDVSGDWRSLVELAENERRFRVIAEAGRDMVTETDREGRFSYVSGACEQVLNYSADELVGSKALDLHHPDDVDAFFDELKAGGKSNQPFVIQPHRLRRRDGSHVWVEALGLMYRDASGARKTLGVARDVTAQIDAEVVKRNLDERVLRSQKLESLGVLAGGVAHDFNNLLTPILGNADLALLDLPADSPIRKRVEMIKAAAVRATALTRQMLAYSGHGVGSVNAVNITSAVNDMALLLNATASSATRIEYELGENLPFVEVDSTHIGQVVMNLVANATECLPEEGGRIEVTTGTLQADRAYLDACFIGDCVEAGEYVYVEVRDTGSGIPVGDRSRIFDPFFTTRFTGRGLGLAAVNGIVRGYKGALDLMSEVGEGTWIRVLFPTAKVGAKLARPAVRTPAPKSVESTQPARGTFLVVDDDENACELMATVLERADYRVIQSCDGPSAIKLFERYQAEIHGVVLDYTMPLMSGGQVFDSIRQFQSDARVILVSGFAQARAADEMMKRGLFGFLQKPFAPDDLLREADRVIAEALSA